MVVEEVALVVGVVVTAEAQVAVEVGVGGLMVMVRVVGNDGSKL